MTTTEQNLRNERNALITRILSGNTRPQLTLDPKTRTWRLTGATQESLRLREINRKLRNLTGVIS